MRKKIALILVVVMAVFMIAGCSGNDDAANQTEPGAGTETTAAEGADTNDAATDQKQDLIGEKKAKEIALKKVKGAKESDIIKFKLDQDDGRQEYEGEIIYDGKEYDFEIDAISGDILSWEEETANN